MPYAIKLIATLKYYNHLIENIKNKTDKPFIKNGVITYVSFRNSLNDGAESLYNVCIVDVDAKKVNYMIVPSFEYDESINYTLLDDVDFEYLSSIYFDYALDTKVGIDYQIKK
ncbi:MAG: hypothetical protein NC037_03345 [Bacteroides sp.]|nr:hypothetical protein [Bacillota bacterium]MCM1455544.1 hypothetical protein [Bacteroides sp.]